MGTFANLKKRTIDGWFLADVDIEVGTVENVRPDGTSFEYVAFDCKYSDVLRVSPSPAIFVRAKDKDDAICKMKRHLEHFMSTRSAESNDVKKVDAA